MIVAEIRVIHAESDGTYGAVKIHDQLCKRGRRMTRRRVAELMHQHGIHGVCGREPGIRTTIRDVAMPVSGPRGAAISAVSS